MGAGASTRRPPPEPTPADVAALDQPFDRDSGDRCFYCLPYDDEMKKRSSLVLLEVGCLGFRLLRPHSDDCLYAFPWGQIHSWAHTDNRFSFRYFDDGKKSVVQYTLFLRDLPQLLEHIQSVIDTILTDRKSLAIPPERFTELLVEMQTYGNGGSVRSPLELLSRQYCSEYYFWSEQGRQLIDAIPSSFDKVEVSVLLHGRLIDQNRFSFMLEGLESQADRDNVWHRITAMKKSASKLHPSGSRAASRGGAASGGGATSPGGGPASPGGAAAF
ncbi:hypothetical protein CHLRE_09g401650v5 [Chlamydomonas reinhardtii]|uniref:Uncharacterized protein n=1 Tax=Chlamydomonas reinhardtii TaxID=3055 RepID=A8J1I7_CHLRE|nr:uncharacterized protein CHLRE_09g401650v5 [Chlamydomonas reinhardtii]PNW78330.1 hypothetical protein CHLRE_09g401650v5 [Chlamydomonas reinhardtii]|eukprot:XP_001695109.1 predicted protein [Chlamydomonas reinhardtii]